MRRPPTATAPMRETRAARAVRRRVPTAAVLALLAAACAEPGPEGAGDAALYRAPPLSNVIDGVAWEAGDWEPHLPAGEEGTSWGNHRAVVVLEPTPVGAEPPDAVVATVPWRRHDPDPGAKSVVVVEAASGEPVADAVALRVEAASGDVAFRPVAGSDTYHVYYMPWRSTGGYYPTVTYPALETVTDAAWEARVRRASLDALPRARVTRIQSVDGFHSFFPMEVAATADEVAPWMAEAADGWLLVPEHRDRPVRMRHHIPRHWTQGWTTDRFESRVLPGEAFTFQLAAVAGAEPLEDVTVGFEGFPPAWAGTLACFNCGGVDETGEPFAKDVDVAPGAVQPLWIGVMVPDDQPPGPVEGDVVVRTGRGSKRVRVALDVRPGRAVNHGFDEPELMTRLFWLNSGLGFDPDFLIVPYEPVTVEGRTLSILGREVVLGPTGLPERILSRFTPELTRLAGEPEDVLARPLALEVVVDGRPEPLEPVRGATEGGEPGPADPGELPTDPGEPPTDPGEPPTDPGDPPGRPAPYAVEAMARGRATWSVASASPRVRVQVEGALEYDGMLDYRIALTALEDLTLDDVRLPVALVPDAAEYMLGLGYRGTKRPERVEWTWDVENHQEGVWLGAVHKGLQYVLRDEGYRRPLNTNFYQDQPLLLPRSWYNGGRGGIRIETAPGAVTATNYSGPRSMAAGETLRFDVRFLLTPFRTVDTGTHFRTRFVHRYVPVDSVRAWGGTVVNIHHANEINPYINYPFYNLDLQAAYIEEAHAKGIKVKLYDTIRELTYRAHELFALRSLGDEILNDGEGGGHSWLQEHLVDGYHAGWHAWRVDDAAVLDRGTSRWTNYYVDGLNWLAENQHIDGLYLDDIAFSRETVKRMVSVLHAHRDEVVIDLHSANQFNPRDGHINSAMLYMEHFPFVSRLWFGEYFEYDRDEDYWMTEVSGLPFGLMGEMLQDGGHPYRGMLYGMTARMYGDTDPRPVWRMMSDFGIDESRMLGYWLEDAPVTTDHPRILATTYVRPDGVLVALASWSDRDEVVSLTLDPDRVPAGRVHAPAVEGLQEAAELDPAAVPVPANQGLFVLVEVEGWR